MCRIELDEFPIYNFPSQHWQALPEVDDQFAKLWKKNRTRNNMPIPPNAPSAPAIARPILPPVLGSLGVLNIDCGSATARTPATRSMIFLEQTNNKNDMESVPPVQSRSKNGSEKPERRVD
jgi:hypothetical protein